MLCRGELLRDWSSGGGGCWLGWGDIVVQVVLIVVDCGERDVVKDRSKPTVV